MDPKLQKEIGEMTNENLIKEMRTREPGTDYYHALMAEALCRVLEHVCPPIWD